MLVSGRTESCFTRYRPWFEKTSARADQSISHKNAVTIRNGYHTVVVCQRVGFLRKTLQLLLSGDPEVLALRTGSAGIEFPQLADAKQKLGFLEASKARVQVTAYALTDDFGPDPVFSNNTPARKAFAVPKHTLPTGKILNVALSPAAEHKLHANLNDTIVLMSRNRRNKHLARFVDRTAQSETRSVVDILFADAHQARIWGRQPFYAVNISQTDSPFHGQ